MSRFAYTLTEKGRRPGNTRAAGPFAVLQAKAGLSSVSTTAPASSTPAI